MRQTVPEHELTADERVQRDVLEELHFDQEVPASSIGVEVNNGIVTLLGTVSSYHKKERAAEAALRVAGARGVANDIEVHLLPTDHRSDAELAEQVAYGLEHSVEIPQGRVQVVVDHGVVTLDGTVNFHYERQAAHQIVRRVPGVVEIVNVLGIHEEPRPMIPPAEIKRQIEHAFVRNAQLHAQGLHVTVHEGRVTLTGHVTAWSERKAAEKAAWTIPGVKHVDNKIDVWY